MQLGTDIENVRDIPMSKSKTTLPVKLLQELFDSPCIP
jgi:hypothetical protein